MENLPRVAVESLACEVPVGAFAVGGNPEILGQRDAQTGLAQRGILVKPFDTGEMGRAVSRLLEDPQLARALGRAGRQWTRHEVGTEKFVDRVIALYEWAAWPKSNDHFARTDAPAHRVRTRSAT